MDIQWYPGHMTKAMRMMREQISQVDLVIELADARVPLSSRNPDLSELARGKKQLLLLTKADLADNSATEQWVRRYRGEGLTVLPFSATAKGGEKNIIPEIRQLLSDKTKRDLEKGKNAELRAMVAGIPNVGKSTLINRLAKKALTKTANKPGVTRGQQWIALPDGIRLLDTPGVLWPKFEDPFTGERLAMIGSMNDVNLDMETLSLRLSETLEERYPGAVGAFYGFTGEDVRGYMETEQTLSYAAGMLHALGMKRGCLARGGRCDYEKAAVTLLADFRNGRVGRFTLELP